MSTGEITWRAHRDIFAAETDTVLASKGEKFLLTIGGEQITIKAATCCAGAPYVLPLTMVKEAKLVSSPFAMPSFVIAGEKMVEAPEGEDGVKPVDADGAPVMVPEHFFHKFFLEGHEPTIVDVCNKVDAQVRLLQGQVLIAGFVDATVADSCIYFSPADAVQLFESEAGMLTMGVGESKTVYLDEDGGEVTFTRLQYGTDMLYKKMDPDFLPSSVFIERAHAICFTLPVYETTVVNPAGDDVKVFRLAHSKDGNEPTMRTVTLDPKVVIAAPYLAGLDRKKKHAARPRAQSFVTRQSTAPEPAPAKKSSMPKIPLPSIPGLTKKKSK